MALQDLTPQLRTRLSRMERAVGWFVLLAIFLLVFGFGYYLYNTAERKGWFKIKAPYYTFVDRATGLKEGDPVQMMGFDVGQVTRIEAQPPEDFYYNVYVEFEIKEPYYGYLWTEGSQARVATADLLGKRVLEVTKGTGGYPTYIFNPLRVVTLPEARSLPEGQWVIGEEILAADGTNFLAKPLWPLTNLPAIAALGQESVVVLDRSEQRNTVTGVWKDKEGRYERFSRNDSSTYYWLLAEESPAVTERLEKLVNHIETALPGVLSLTNQLGAVLSNTAALTSNLNAMALAAQPGISNLAEATRQIDRPGGLGEWLLPTNVNDRLLTVLSNASSTFGTANTTLTSANTNLAALAESLQRSLDNLAGMTSNLNAQVASNTNILSAISETIVHADQFVQGLKRHWLFRSAFRKKTEQATPPGLSPDRLKSPKDQGSSR